MVEPEDVANAIVRALRKPRFDVYVPSYLGPLQNFLRLFPRRVGEFLLRSGGSDRLLSDAAHSSARADYEQRAAR